MSGVPIEAIGFVGVTSRYAESLELLSKIVGFQVPLLKKNVAPESKNSSNIDPFEKFRPEVLSLNDSDCELYKLSNEILDKRLRYEKFGQIFAHAKSWRDRNGVPVGWAYYDENSPPPVVQLLNSEGESIDEMPATLHRPDLAALKVPRSGFVGFRFESPEAIKSGVMIQLEENGQKVDLSV
ncbi:hypothetical protein MNKW57_30570 [Biformimicrobium ophioploci]|uniref:Uncharacterized protein n=2 Tax=Biformimicrobium ophioploci TaxID=3036711 RepID=A0ABQ6M309_9GAMM|nr:hypothetical protein MNKW57_30570 [Microbulbifer sp. NKW57]